MPVSPFDLIPSALSAPTPDPALNATNDIFWIGEFVVGGYDLSNLGGHPDIRY